MEYLNQKKTINKRNKGLIGLAPMDGLTDAAFRYMFDKYSKPDILFTEFNSAEGIAAGAKTLLNAFIYHQSETTLIGQLFGIEPEAFYKSAFVLLELGYDGIDINMGCPDKNVTRRGAGAGLIKNPDLAIDIIKAVHKAREEWLNGKEIGKVGLKNKIIDWIKTNNLYKKAKVSKQKYLSIKNVNKIPTVSIKTRTGYDKHITQEWIKTLLETDPDMLSLHGRTLNQMYSGEADWEEIGRAAEIVKKTDTVFLGNGDIKSKEEAKEKIKKYKVDGVLIGRATFGNPWLLKNITPTKELRFQTMIEHCQAFMDLTPQLNFLSLRKHLGWYCKDFPNASKIRTELMKTSSVEEVKDILNASLLT